MVFQHHLLVQGSLSWSQLPPLFLSKNYSHILKGESHLKSHSILVLASGCSVECHVYFAQRVQREINAQTTQRIL